MELISPSSGLIFWTIFTLSLIIIPIIALLSLLKTTFKDSTTKLIWLIVILFVPLLGSIFYFIIGRSTCNFELKNSLIVTKKTKLLIVLLLIVIILPIATMVFFMLTTGISKPTKVRVQVGLTDEQVDSLLKELDHK